MSVNVIVNIDTIYGFLGDKEAFDSWASARFAELDTNKDGVLSYSEILKELDCHRVFERRFGIPPKTDPDELVKVYIRLFKKFDRDSNGAVDFEEFKSATRRLMMDTADGIGCLPHEVSVANGSFLHKAFEWESINRAREWW